MLTPPHGPHLGSCPYIYISLFVHVYIYIIYIYMHGICGNGRLVWPFQAESILAGAAHLSSGQVLQPSAAVKLLPGQQAPQDARHVGLQVYGGPFLGGNPF